MDYRIVHVDSTFPVAQRPVYLLPTANVIYKEKETAYPLLSRAIAEILLRHPLDRILIHTVSYELNSFLHKQLLGSGRVVTYSTAQERQAAIDEYLHYPAKVLLAPSLDRGIDLPGDDCRAIVVCKVPFPSLSDKQISARLHSQGGQTWYTVQTIRKLVQMTGRGMRSAEDACESYILDRQFLQLHRKSKHLFPGWWSDAIIWNARDHFNQPRQDHFNQSQRGSNV